MGFSKHVLREWWRRKKQKAEQETDEGKKGSNTAAAAAARKEPPKNIANVPSDTDVSTGAQKPSNTPEEKGSPDLSISQILWNRAYDELAKDKGTSDIVENYMRIIPKAIDPDGDFNEAVSDDIMRDMNDPIRRQAILKDSIKAGQARIARVQKATNVVGGVVELINRFKGVIDVAVKANPQVALPWAGVCIGLQFLLNPAQELESQRNGIAFVITRMEWYCSLASHLLSQENIDLKGQSYQPVVNELEGRVVALYKALLLYQMKSVCSYYKNHCLVILRSTINLDDWDGEIQGIESAEKAVLNDLRHYYALYSKEALGHLVRQVQECQKILSDFHQIQQEHITSQYLQQIRIVDPQAEMVNIQGRNDKLLPAAYKWIVDTPEYRGFTNWSDPGSCRVLWLSGPAGTGKTMLVIGIISEISRQSFNMAPPGLAYFFFQASRSNMTSPTDALRSLIWMLLIQQPRLFSYIRETLTNAGASYFDSAGVFWPLAEIFKQMLADKDLTPVYLTLDALDECDERKAENPGLAHLLSLVSDTLSITDKVKWLLSSRPEINVYNKLKNKQASGEIVELNVQSRPEPVNAYIKHKLSDLERNYEYSKYVLDEMSQEIRQRAQNTFLWVSLVFKDIIDNNVAEYDAVDRIKASPSSLISLYERLMTRIENLPSRDPRFCRSVLAAACFSYRPLSYAELHVASGLPANVRPQLIVPKCGSFLTVQDNRVYMIHATAREHLDDYFKSSSSGNGNCHRDDIGKRSIQAMSDALKRNIYSITPDKESTDVIVPEKDPLASVRYSCEFWVDHLCEDRGGQNFDDERVFSFLEEHFLHWLESLSLIQKLPTAVPSIKKLLINSKRVEFINFLKDAERFALRNLQVMRQVPLQTYGSALAFSPSKSQVKSRYWKERLPFIRTVQGGRGTWDPCLQTFTADNSLGSILFSPDGRFLASVSEWRGSVLLWNVTTGTRHTLITQHARETPLAFSPDSQVIASYVSRQVDLWDVATGKGIQSFEVHYVVSAMQFSLDGKVLVLATRTVELWDIATMSCIRTLDGHTECVRCLAFTPCRKILASASDDMTVKLWEFETSSCKLTMRLPGYPKNITFSPDGNILAASLADGSIHILNTATGDTIRTLGGDIPCVAGSFLVDGETIATVTNNVELQFIDVATGTCKLTLKHGNKICASSVSQNILASGTVDGMVRLWDTTGNWRQSPGGLDESVSSMAFSSDGKSLAVGLVGKTVEIWDSFDKICRRRLEGHRDRIATVAFSADNKTLASGSWDCTFRLWDPTTGAAIRTVDTGRGKVHFVKFSPDGKMLAVSTEDPEDPKSRTVTVWDAVTGTCKQTLDSGVYFHNLAFSHDSMVILMASTIHSSDGKTRYFNLQLDRGFRVWDVATGAWKLTVTETTEFFDSIAISPDGKTIASSFSSAPGIQTWDASTGDARQFIEYDEYKVVNQNLSFSNDGRYLDTNQGPYRLTTGGLATCPDPELSQSVVYIKENLGSSSWVMRGSKPLLQLPPEHSKSSFATRKNMLVLGNVEGLTFVEFESC
ncbi:hypothetical protein N7524_004470 [Penicillium chrysogenum]|nr:hypothetical protein N7524_004470 [Penicillium chrysogenum]